MVAPLGPSAARTGRVSYTFFSSLPALSQSAASHIKVSRVLPLVVPPLRLHCFVFLPSVFLARPLIGEQAGALLFHVS